MQIDKEERERQTLMALCRALIAAVEGRPAEAQQEIATARALQAKGKAE